jgi:hypothetical protein
MELVPGSTLEHPIEIAVAILVAVVAVLMLVRRARRG